MDRTRAHRSEPVVIEGEVEGGGGGDGTSTLTYHAAGSTTFERKLVYSMPNPLLALIDLLVLRRRAAAELAEALRRLEYGLEGSAA